MRTADADGSRNEGPRFVEKRQFTTTGLPDLPPRLACFRPYIRSLGGRIHQSSQDLPWALEGTAAVRCLEVVHEYYITCLPIEINGVVLKRHAYAIQRKLGNFTAITEKRVSR